MVLIRYEAKERAQGQLLAGISSGAISLVLDPGQGASFPTTYPFVLTLEKVTTNAYGVKTVTAFEDVKCTLRATDTFTIERGFNGTTAIAFDADDYVSLYATAIIIDDIQDAIQDMETNKLNRNAQLRTWNTARRLPYFGASGNEVELAFSTSGNVLQTNGATSAPTRVAQSVNISGLTEDTAPDHTNDFMLVYDTSAGTNKKVKMNSFLGTSALLKESGIGLVSLSLLMSVCGYTIGAGTTYTHAESNSIHTSVELAYTKIKEIVVNQSGTYSVSFEMSNNGGFNTCSARIYKNGVALWTVRTQSTATYTSYSQDLAFVKWDIVQIYGLVAFYNPASYICRIQNYKIRYNATDNRTVANWTSVGTVNI